MKTDFFSLIESIILSDDNKDTKESSNESLELTGDIKLIIHEVIDDIHNTSTKKMENLIDDIRRRLDIETNGHKLDKDGLKSNLNNLINDYLVDIYADDDNKPRSTGDYFKYAVTQYLSSNFDKIFEQVNKDGSEPKTNDDTKE